MDRAAWILIYLAPFIQHCEIHLCYLFLCNTIFHWLNRPQLTHLTADVHLSCFWFWAVKNGETVLVACLLVRIDMRAFLKGVCVGLELRSRRVFVSSFQTVVPVTMLTNNMWVFRVSCCLTASLTPGIVRLNIFATLWIRRFTETLVWCFPRWPVRLDTCQYA